MRQPSRRWTGRAAVAVIAAALLVVPGSMAMADPDVTDDDVQQAQEAVGTASDAVADMEVRLAQLSAESDQAQIAVQEAGESYAQAQADLTSAQQTATEAQAKYEDAQEDLESARSTLVAIAREAARNGGSMDDVQALLSAEGLEDLVARNEALGLVSSKADQAVQSYRAADQVASTLKEEADSAQEAKEAAATDAESSLAAAETAQADADAALASAATERQSLIQRLAAARNTSAEVEQQRQDQIDADRRAQAEASAEADRTQEPAPSTPSTPSTPTPSTPTPSNPTPSNPTPSNPTPTTPAPTNPGTGGGSSSGSTTSAEVAIAWAKTQLGKPYIWGGTGPTGYDCSGLTQGAWRAAGVSLNRTSRDQYRQVQKVSYNDMRPGDLIFYGNNANDASSIYHVAMYLGNGQMIEAPKPGDVVKIASVRWSNSMAYAGRP